MNWQEKNNIVKFIATFYLTITCDALYLDMTAKY